ncbi:hypothetical protein BJ085DRAFT_34500 [Dimargaris cristalligena]|uniref:F-box domain-containing protein n=1 Tax=Dimargaris cristalligena TaxID=215637 RepID=A0A4Q0A0C7_9FUNG|nr:hypothetical protein BJ085DRAFT_34500 [Dimargaris cristalligena]|eukprot:RKP39447.1 hypothetical protein BJ085DRAFT_34500 [Dimargaris cristalligena]
MSTNSTTQILAFPNASESETRQQRRTFWVRLNRYARNTDILALASTNRAHANALRPHCFRHVRISTGVDSTHGAFRTIVNHQAAIEHLQCLVLQDVDLHYPLKFIQAVSLGGLEQLVMKNVFAYSSVVSPTTPSHSTPRTSMHLTSLVLNGVGLGDTVLKSIVDLLGPGLCILRLINCTCNQWEVSYALAQCSWLTHFDLSHRDEVFTRDLFPSEFASKNILYLRLAFNFVAIAWFQPALCKLQQLRQLSLYKPTCPQLQRIRRALPQLAIHFITTEEFNNLVNREYVERVADR